MKYKVGDMTLLGEIDDVDESWTTYPYRICNNNDYYRFSESEVDKIAIKPKRNIDKMMELWDKGLHDDAVEILRACLRFTSYEDIVELRKPYIEPSRYPKLTPEELKAVKWLVEGGYETLTKGGCDYGLGKSNGLAMAYVFEASMPFVKAFCESKWITETPINLKELLEAQEVV